MSFKVKRLPHTCAQKMICWRYPCCSPRPTGQWDAVPELRTVARRAAAPCCPQGPFLGGPPRDPPSWPMLLHRSSSNTLSTCHRYICFWHLPPAVLFIALRVCVCVGVYPFLCLPEPGTWGRGPCSGVRRCVTFGKPPTSPDPYIFVCAVVTVISERPVLKGMGSNADV